MTENLSASDIVEQKKQTRAEYTKRRNSLSRDSHALFSEQACAAMFAKIISTPFKSIGVFWSISGEINTLPLIKQLIDHGYEVGLPITGKFATSLTFKKFEGEHRLISGKFNTKEPHSDCPQLYPDFLVVPLLAYDEHFYRLGYGGGHYDATITSLSKRGPLLSYGIAFSTQKITKVPREPHDMPLDGIITEQSNQNPSS